MFHTTAAGCPHGVSVLLFALGIAKTLDLGVAMTMGPSCPSVQLRQGQDKLQEKLGHPWPNKAPEAGAGWELATEHFVKGKK